MSEEITKEEIKATVNLIDINAAEPNNQNFKSKPHLLNHNKRNLHYDIKTSKKDYILISIPLFLIFSLFFYILKGAISKRTSIQLIKVKDKKEMALVSGEILYKLIHENPRAKLGLSSGSTPKSVYKYLIDKYEDKELNFEKIKIFDLNEFCEIGNYTISSFEHYIKDNLLNHVNVEENNIFLMKNNVENCENYANKYNDLLKDNIIDLQMISIGKDGHFGFNEPGVEYNIKTHVVKLSQKMQEEFLEKFDYDIEKVPKYGITLGIENIMEAKRVLIIASGKEKAVGIKSLFRGTPTQDIPISALRNHKGIVYVVADDEACSLM